MANGHGGKRPGSGRPRKSLADKILDGSTKKHKAKVLNIPNIEDVFSPEPPEYLRHFNANGITNAVPKMEDIYKETAEWLEKTDCLHLINPALITHYSLLITRWMECEDIVSRALIMKNEKKEIIANPMAAQALQYKKAADIAWDRIWAIVAQNCESYYGGKSPHEDLMEKLIGIHREG